VGPSASVLPVSGSSDELAASLLLDADSAIGAAGSAQPHCASIEQAPIVSFHRDRMLVSPLPWCRCGAESFTQRVPTRRMTDAGGTRMRRMTHAMLGRGWVG